MIFADKICEWGRKKIYEYYSMCEGVKCEVNENVDSIVLKVHYFRQNRNVFNNAWGWETNFGPEEEDKAGKFLNIDMFSACNAAFLPY